MKFLLVVVALIAGSVYGIHRALNSPSFFEYVFSNPDLSPKFSYYYGVILEQYGEPARADSFYDVVVSTYPSHQLAAGALVKMADIRNGGLRFAEALELYKKFVVDYPDDPRVPRVRKNIEIIMSR
jgi:TolA-binding protein